MDKFSTDNLVVDNGRAAWIRHWADIGPKLARIRAEELRSMSPAEARLAIEALLELASEFPARPPGSGLVEYQRRIRGRKL